MVTSSDEKGAEEVTLRKSTLFIVALLPAFLVLVLQIGTPFIGFIRDDQSRTVQLNTLQKTVDAFVVKQDAQSLDIQAIKQTLIEIQRSKTVK